MRSVYKPSKQSSTLYRIEIIKPILVIGCGGHAHSVIELIKSTGEWYAWGMVGKPNDIGKKINGIEVKGTDENLQELKQSCSNAVIGIGQIKTPSIREKIANKLVQIGYNTPAIISKYAVVSEGANVKEGVTVGHGSIVNANAYIGKFCIINTGAILEHSTRVGDFCHISTGVIVNGDVDIGEGSFVGSGSIIREGLKIPVSTTISAGSRVMGWPLKQC